jgi:hypothetical protein
MCEFGFESGDKIIFKYDAAIRNISLEAYKRDETVRRINFSIKIWE